MTLLKDQTVNFFPVKSVDPVLPPEKRPKTMDEEVDVEGGGRGGGGRVEGGGEAKTPVVGGKAKVEEKQVEEEDPDAFFYPKDFLPKKSRKRYFQNFQQKKTDFLTEYHFLEKYVIFNSNLNPDLIIFRTSGHPHHGQDEEEERSESTDSSLSSFSSFDEDFEIYGPFVADEEGRGEAEGGAGEVRHDEDDEEGEGRRREAGTVGWVRKVASFAGLPTMEDWLTPKEEDNLRKGKEAKEGNEGGRRKGAGIKHRRFLYRLLFSLLPPPSLSFPFLFLLLSVSCDQSLSCFTGTFKQL
jgi:hypothetical protein